MTTLEARCRTPISDLFRENAALVCRPLRASLRQEPEPLRRRLGLTRFDGYARY